jgi:hypothetical protein
MRRVSLVENREVNTFLTVRRHSYLSLVPFIFGAFLIWLTPSVFDPVTTFSWLGYILIYGAVALTFLSAARWGAAVSARRAQVLGASIIPVLVGWFAVVLSAGDDIRFTILMIAYLLMTVVEVGAREPGSAEDSLLLTGIASTLLILLIVLGLVG